MGFAPKARIIKRTPALKELMDMLGGFPFLVREQDVRTSSKSGKKLGVASSVSL
jgi:hypothetical protein